MSGKGSRGARKVRADQIGLRKTERNAGGLKMTVLVKFHPDEVVAVDKLVEVYGGSRAQIVRTIVRRFLSEDDDVQRSVLLEEELCCKRAKLQAEKLRIEKELSVVESDMFRLGKGFTGKTTMKGET